MNDHDLDEKARRAAGEPTPGLPADTDLVEAPVEGELAASAAPTALGATRHVLAGFFAAGIAIAFLVGNILNAAWNRLANSTWIAQRAPLISRIAEDERPSYTTVFGAALGAAVVIYAYRRADVRDWTSEVAAELAKVSWPSKKEVTNSTMVVIATGAFATVFLALLDRFWGFVTNLVYGS